MDMYIYGIRKAEKCRA